VGLESRERRRIPPKEGAVEKSCRCLDKTSKLTERKKKGRIFNRNPEGGI